MADLRSHTLNRHVFAGLQICKVVLMIFSIVCFNFFFFLQASLQDNIAVICVVAAGIPLFFLKMEERC